MNLSQNNKSKQSGTKSKIPKTLLSFLILVLMIAGFKPVLAQQKEMMVRISEIEIHPSYLEAYKAILKEEAAASVKLEPGVLAIFPMYQKESPTQVRILEMYVNKTAYENHLKTPHFQKYKTTTLNMVKSLKLVDMETMDEESMALMFQKFKE